MVEMKSKPTDKEKLEAIKNICDQVNVFCMSADEAVNFIKELLAGKRGVIIIDGVSNLAKGDLAEPVEANVEE